MSIIGRITDFFSKIVEGVIRTRTEAVVKELLSEEQGLARDLARQLRVSPSAVVVVAHPVPRIELKVALSRAQLAKAEEFLDKLKVTPRVNSRARLGMH